VARFDGRNPRAEAWLADRSSTLIREIVEETRAAARVMLQQRMVEGVNPMTTARDLVGRINQATGRREGGIIGLTRNQSATVQRAFDQLRSGDPAQLEAYLERRLRDRRFDSVVRRAIRDGKPVPMDQARKMRVHYERRYQYYRGTVIARTETLRSLHHSQDEAMQQLIDDGRLERDQVIRVWDATGDGRTRPTHMEADGQRRKPGEAFIVGGARLRFPGDPAGPARETIQCRCVVRVEIDFYAGVT
jgi:hypothetical protein